MVSPFIPLILATLVIGILAVVGYVVYSIVTDIADKTTQKMEEKHITFGKDGMKVGIKEIKSEDYVGKTQSVLVNVWNLSSWPAYKSRFWNKEKPSTAATGSAAARPGVARAASSSSHLKKA